MTAPQPVIHRGIVKQVLSGDAVIIRGQPKGGPPPERQLNLSNITAPKLARRANPMLENSSETKDEPYAWEAREFLRKKLVGKEICFIVEYTTPIGREYGCIYIGKDLTGENVTASLVSEGFVDVRRGGIKATDEQQHLCDLEDIAKAANKGKHDTSSHPLHIRNMKWTIENPRHFLDSHHGEPINSVVEYVRDGCTVRVILFPTFHTITLMISGIKCPTFKLDGTQNVEEPYAAEAKFFTESRLLQTDVEVILESVSNQNFVGSIIHPKGNIAELLLREGFAKCVDWNMASVTHGAEVLRAAEKCAKEKRLRVWKDYEPKGPAVDAKDKQFQAKVLEVSNSDALVVQGPNGSARKIFLASIRPPRLPDQSESANNALAKDRGSRQFRPLYDIPYMFEAREFLRKKLVGKKVSVTIDYIQPKSDNFPEKVCCTVIIGGINVAEALISKGLATVVRYRADNDQRSAHYDELLAAESKAIKNAQGLHSKKETPLHRVADVSGDSAKAKQFLPFLQRAGRSEAIVEYVMSGSRLRLYVPRETCLITFLLGGITCPRAARRLPGNAIVEGEPWGEEALQFTKDKCLQKEVEIEIDLMDKAGGFIGWLYVDGINLSVALVEEGFASVHFSAERSVHAKALQQAEENAKQKKENIWANYEEVKIEKDLVEEVQERKINQKSVIVTEVTKEFHFYAQYADKVAKLDELMKQLRQELTSKPPLPGSYNPQRGNMCAAKFVDGEWYRAKIEKIANKEIHIFYVDYGNREITDSSKVVALPSVCQGLPSLAHEFSLACVKVPDDPEFKLDALEQFKNDTLNKEMILNVEYRISNVEYVTLLFSDTKEDEAKNLISDGLLLVEHRKEKRLQKLVTEYAKAQESAKAERLNLWRYGDFTEDDADEFGFR